MSTYRFHGSVPKLGDISVGAIFILDALLRGDTQLVNQFRRLEGQRGLTDTTDFPKTLDVNRSGETQH